MFIVFIAQHYIRFWCFESLMHCLLSFTGLLSPLFFASFHHHILSFCTITVFGIFLHMLSYYSCLYFDIFIILFNLDIWSWNELFMVLKCIKPSSGDWFPIHKNIYLAIKGVKHSGSYSGYDNKNVYSFTCFH